MNFPKVTGQWLQATREFLSHFCHSENVIQRDQKTSYVNVLIRDIL